MMMIMMAGGGGAMDSNPFSISGEFRNEVTKNNIPKNNLLFLE
jgi:hypothetical protein